MTLVTAQEELERIFNLSLDMICTAGFDGYFKKVNPSFTRVLGHSNEELLAKPFIDFVHPDDVAATLAEVEKLSTGAKALKFTNRYRCKDGSYRWLQWTSHPDVATETLYAVAHDITEQKMIQQKLHDTERQLRLSFDNATVGMTWSKSDGRFFRVNHAFCELAGHSEEEILMMGPKDLVHPDDQGYQGELMKKLITGQIDSFVHDLRLVKKDGRVINIRIHAVFIKNNVVGSGYFFTQVEDITKQKEAEAALRESELRFRSIFEDSPVAINYFDSEGNFVYANQAALAMFGVEEDKGMKDLNILSDPNTPHEIVEQVSRGEIARYEAHFDFEKVKENGIYETSKSGIMYLDAVLSPLRLSADDSVKGYLVQLLDISERKRAEEMQKRLNEELEAIVEERTRELKDAQEELVRKQRLATLGQISGGIGHELRNPLGAIKNAGFLLNLILENPTDEVKRSLAILDKEIVNCERIISSLMDFARPKPPRFQKIIMNETVKLITSRVAIPDDIEVIEELDEGLPIILGDLTQLEIVLTNLLANAIQAMPSGGALTLGTSLLSENRISITVSDTGIGVPEENLHQLFEPLFTTKAKGIGLGLSIVKTIVESHSGTISVESEVGKGTTFNFVLPISPGSE
jgi:PAS domain S-box-containing protein